MTKSKSKAKKSSVSQIYDKYYGPNGKYAKKKAQNDEQKARLIQAVKEKQAARPDGSTVSRNQMMIQAKEKGIRNFRILNKAELTEILKPDTSQERAKEIVDTAVSRWKSGWGTKSQNKEQTNV